MKQVNLHDDKLIEIIGFDECIQIIYRALDTVNDGLGKVDPTVNVMLDFIFTYAGLNNAPKYITNDK